MAALSHQSFANTTTPYWASAVEPTTLVSPVTVVDSVGVPTKKTSIFATDLGAGGVVVSDINNANPVGMTLEQGATQPLNQILFDIGNVAPVLAVTAFSVIATQPIILDQGNNPDTFIITQLPTTTVLQQGTGATVEFGAGEINFSGITSIDTFGTIQALTPTASVVMSLTNQAFSAENAAAATQANFGLSGTSAYVSTGLLPLTASPGLLVNQNNGSTVRFRDTGTAPFEMAAVGANVVLSTPNLPIPAPPPVAAITIAPSGQVSIPDLISTSSVPVGGIIMYSGNVLLIPANYAICDGTAGTPDLRNRFIIGAGTFASGTSGGSATISINNMPIHSHVITDPGHAHDVVLTQLFNNGQTGAGAVYPGQSLTGGAGSRASDPGAAQTALTGITTTQSTGSGFDYYQPYFSLVFIMRMI